MDIKINQIKIKISDGINTTNQVVKYPDNADNVNYLPIKNIWDRFASKNQKKKVEKTFKDMKYVKFTNFFQPY